ncbi:MAG: tetratricopeptide repeat protein [Candidatus Riflebacteria bacterium]|nr:tetratricopeptide repeat protein [Candidatus Riflebacteria bacterium]
MLKKLWLVLLLILPCAVSGQVYLFKDCLQPTTPELVKELEAIQAPGQTLDNHIDELRKIAYQNGSAQQTKTNLAAFILRKVTLNRNLTYEDNEDLILEASDLVPGDYYLESLWGDLLYFKGDYDKALTHYDNALYKSPDDITLHSRAGLTAMQLMQYEKAVGYFEKVLSTRPDDFYTIFSLGRCHFELKHLEECLEYWEKALTLAKDDRDKTAVQNSINQAKELLASTGDATREEDQRFVIHFAGNSQEDLGDITFAMLEEIFFQVTDALNFQPDVKINVIFFLTEEYYKIGRDWSAGSAQGIKIMVPLKSGYKSPDYVKGLLAHEFTHTIIHLRTNNRCPLWLNEGLAQYQEFAAANGSPDSMRSDYDGILQREFIDKRSFVNLNQVPAIMNSSSRADISKAYIASYLAVRCMADFYGEQSFDSLLSALGRGKTVDEAMTEATGKNMADFQEEYEEWLRNL